MDLLSSTKKLLLDTTNYVLRENELESFSDFGIDRILETILGGSIKIQVTKVNSIINFCTGFYFRINNPLLTGQIFYIVIFCL